MEQENNDKDKRGIVLNKDDSVERQFHSAVDRLNVILANAEIADFKRNAERDRRQYEHDRKDLIVRIVLIVWLIVLSLIALHNTISIAGVTGHW